ncbi:retroelement pol polyprotein [Cystoisospora suis]|uniref:Retroelement pol polyprotein n=1 Tax=Cystoisospora suis TaxID=483139 RepID=A0A2C6KK89_9APIC|nr:retroelement pol polyprotein [Cystoisospora suis]
MVVDYRALNGITIKEEYLLSRIHDMIDRLGKARWFSKLDLQSDHHQVEVSEAEQLKTDFRPRYGTFQFIVTPSGLAGAPSTFQRLMPNILLQELDDSVMVYLDDVLVYSATRQLHIHQLKNVSSNMREELYVKLAKCEFCQQRVPYLGFVISSEGIAADPAKLKTLRDWPEILNNTKQLRGFLGLVGYYRRLVPNFNKLAHPLHRLLKEDSDMVWRMEHSEAVKNLKEALINRPDSNCSTQISLLS